MNFPREVKAFATSYLSGALNVSHLQSELFWSKEYRGGQISFRFILKCKEKVSYLQGETLNSYWFWSAFLMEIENSVSQIISYIAISRAD